MTPDLRLEPWGYGPCDGCDYAEAVTVGDMWDHLANPGRWCRRAAADFIAQTLKSHRGNRVNASLAAHRIMQLMDLAIEEGKKRGALEGTER